MMGSTVIAASAVSATVFSISVTNRHGPALAGTGAGGDGA
jgi:hypothetical protein